MKSVVLSAFLNSSLLLLTFFFFLFVGSCESIGDDGKDNKSADEALIPFIESFMSCYEPIKEKEAFLFFSDPHLVGHSNVFGNYEKSFFNNAFESMRVLYEALPFSFCLCGGDWLKNKDTQEVAKWKLEYADSKMKEWFPSYYKMLGNHDTNYQGVVSPDDASRGDLPYDYINSVYFKETGNAYYTIKGENTLFVVIDSGIDWETALDDYRKQQIEWLSQLLYTNTEQHIVIGMHMFLNGKVENKRLMPMSREIVRLCGAFNRRETFVLETNNYDFSIAKGKVHFIICGHNHVDFEYLEGDVPCVGITNLITNNQPSYDLCIIDYDKGCLDMIRVGEGQNRQIPFTL